MAEAHSIKLRMVTPERVMFEEDVNGVTIMTAMGQVTILPDHVPLVTVLKPGEMIVHVGQEHRPLVVSGGIMEVSQQQITVLADTAEHVQELDLEQAKKAVELAQSLLREKKYDLREYETLKANLDKERVRVNAFTKWRK